MTPGAPRVLLPGRREVALAVAVGAVTLAGTWVAALPQATAGIDPGTAAAVLAAAGAWAWYRVAPVVAAVAVAGVVAGHLLAGGPYGPIQLVVVLACYAVARHRRFRVAAATCGVAALVLAAALATRLDLTHPAGVAAVLLAWPGVFVVVPGLVGALVRTRVQADARERAQLLARGADQERLRVTREVHDIAGHSFAVIAMQAGVALTVFDEQPEQARTSLRAIRSSSEHALRELHAALDALSAGPPTVDDVPALVERVRSAGLPVRLDLTGDPHDLDLDASVAVYRVVQEALTNVVRHAGPTDAVVTLRCGADTASVRVTDRGDGAPEGVDPAGRGLRGLRERVERLGGTFTATSRGSGGFEVVARLPGQGARA
jgi:signal transduction histidine kinase